MSVFSGPADWWTNDTDIGRTHIATKGIVQSGLVLNLDSGVAASYPGSGTTWFDLSPSNLNFTVNSSFINNQGLSSDSSASSASTSILNTDNHSIFFMMKMNSNVTYPNGHSGSWSQIFTYAGGGSDRSPGVWRYPSNRLIHWRFDPGNSDADFSATESTLYPVTGTEFSLNTWHFIGVSKAGATAKTYVNGRKLADRSVSNPKTAGNAAITLWGYYTASAIMNCVHVYDREVTEAEVKRNFNALRGRFGI
jgi:hypothetical protein